MSDPTDSHEILGQYDYINGISPNYELNVRLLPSAHCSAVLMTLLFTSLRCSTCMSVILVASTPSDVLH